MYGINHGTMWEHVAYFIYLKIYFQPYEDLNALSMSISQYCFRQWLGVISVRPSLPTYTYSLLTLSLEEVTHWGRVMHIYVSKLSIIGSDNGLLPGRCQAVTWSNADLLLIGPLGTNFSEIFNWNSNISIQGNVLENDVCKLAAILSRGKWVNRECVPRAEDHRKPTISATSARIM